VHTKQGQKREVEHAAALPNNLLAPSACDCGSTAGYSAQATLCRHKGCCIAAMHPGVMCQLLICLLCFCSSAVVRHMLLDALLAVSAAAGLR
jgi:hypothetical protein